MVFCHESPFPSSGAGGSPPALPVPGCLPPVTMAMMLREQPQTNRIKETKPQTIPNYTLAAKITFFPCDYLSGLSRAVGPVCSRHSLLAWAVSTFLSCKAASALCGLTAFDNHPRLLSKLPGFR